MSKQGKAKPGQNSPTNLHDKRRQAHDMGIEGSSKMSMEQLDNAIKMVDKGIDPMTAKQEAKRDMM